MNGYLFSTGAGFGLAALAIGWSVWFRDAPSGEQSSRSVTAGVEPAEPARAATRRHARTERAATRTRDRVALKGKLAELEARLGAIEAAGEEAVVDVDTEAEAHTELDPATQGPLAESELGHWMDAAIATEAWNSEWTRESQERLESRLEEMENVELQGVECIDSFCRATLFRTDGETPAVGPLLGGPPLTGEGFTLSHPDGRVDIYYARAGQSLEALRDQALAAQ